MNNMICNYMPKPKAVVFVSKYMIKKYGEDEAFKRAILKGKKVYKMNPDFTIATN